jgi:hypothetical protein
VLLLQPPPQLRKHHLLDPDITPAPIPVPHPGTSYNPSFPDHQQLLKTAVEGIEDEEERLARFKEIKERLDSSRRKETREGWQLFEEEVGSGEEEDGAEGGPAQKDDVSVRVPSRAKTSREKKKRRLNKLLEVRPLSHFFIFLIQAVDGTTLAGKFPKQEGYRGVPAAHDCKPFACCVFAFLCRDELSLASREATSRSEG